MSISITSALDDVLDYFKAMPDVAEAAAVLAINDVTQSEAVVAARREIRKTVAFPKGYLERPDRLRMTKRARKGQLVAEVVGRDRPTSLARFAVGQNAENTRGRKVVVNVQPGKKVRLDKAFIINLRNGNQGLAVRLKAGQTLRNTQGAVPIGDNLYLLYGPSVDQVYRQQIDTFTPQMLTEISREFRRQFTRLSRG